MSSVVISNRSLFNQRVTSIEKNKVLLPFNVKKEQSKKLETLLSKIKVTFLCEQDKLGISELKYNDLNIKTNDRTLNDCNFTLSKTYVVTIKQSFISKVQSFYNRIWREKEPERPVFNIGNETNLQQALAEATTEIDLSAINASLNTQPALENRVEQPTSQVLANNPLGETKIENSVNLTPAESTITEQNAMVAPVIENTNPVTEQKENPVPVVEQQNIVQNVPQQNIPQQSVEASVNTEVAVQQEKPKVKKLKGNVLAVPIVVVWLGAVFYGTLKLVTSILT